MDMIEQQDATRVIDTVAENLRGIARNASNFQKLPDTFWGYFAKGHDSKGRFAVVVTYSERGDDVDALLKFYEEWVARNKVK